jgi:hypothetical protein
MLDMFGFPTTSPVSEPAIFTTGGLQVNDRPLVYWHKPRGARLVSGLLMGAGGGGGGGRTGASLSQRGGGGGGGPGAVFKFLIPAIFLPESVGISLGQGGGGGGGNTDGSAGTPSYLFFRDHLIVQANNGSAGLQGGTGAGGRVGCRR